MWEDIAWNKDDTSVVDVWFCFCVCAFWVLIQNEFPMHAGPKAREPLC